jgi:hypothetical protein
MEEERKKNNDQNRKVVGESWVRGTVQEKLRADQTSTANELIYNNKPQINNTTNYSDPPWGNFFWFFI